MATQLSLYNKALLHCKSQSLSSTSEAVERRRVIDGFYTDTIALMLEKGFWKFAMRTVEIEADDATSPAFGPANAFTKPEDWVKTYWLSGSETGDPPLDDWLEEANMFFADSEPIYLRYVSNDAEYGNALSRWTARFELAFTLELAYWIYPKVTGGGDRQQLETDKKNALSEALAHEALREPVRRPPQGLWNRARGRSYPKRYPGGWRF